MVVACLKLLFGSLNSVVSLASLVLFKGSATIVVLLISTLKIPGHAFDRLLLQLRNSTDRAADYAVHAALNISKSLASEGFRHLNGTGSRIVNGANSFIEELVKRFGPFMDSMRESLWEIFGDIVAMVKNMGIDVVSNFWDALKYFIENV